MDGLSSLVAESQYKFCRNLGSRAMQSSAHGATWMCGWDRAGALKLHNCSSGMMFMVIMKKFLHGDHMVRSWGAAVRDNWVLWTFPIQSHSGPQQREGWCQPWICISGSSLLIWSSLKWSCSEIKVDMFCCELPEMHLWEVPTGAGVFFHLHTFQDGKSRCKAILFLLFMVVSSPCWSDQRVSCQGLLFCCTSMFYFKTTEP